MIVTEPRCPHCKGPVIIHEDFLSCYRMCGSGLFTPSDCGVWTSIKQLRKSFPKLASTRGTDRARGTQRGERR